MAFKRRYRSKKSRRGRYSRKYRRTSLKKTISRVLSRKSETKYFDVGNQNMQLYHNTGLSGYSYVGPVVFNPWSNIVNGSWRYMRVGDKIQPIGFKYKAFLANKLDRPNIHYRVVVCIMPRMYGGAVVTGGSMDPCVPMNAGSCANYALLPFDKEKGIKVLYDRIYRSEAGYSAYATGVAGDQDGKEYHKFISLWIKRKRSRPITYDIAGQITNNYLAVYVIPYDSYGTLTTDNIASMAHTYRMYWKDL